MDKTDETYIRAKSGTGTPDYHYHAMSAIFGAVEDISQFAADANLEFNQLLFTDKDTGEPFIIVHDTNYNLGIFQSETKQC